MLTVSLWRKWEERIEKYIDENNLRRWTKKEKETINEQRHVLTSSSTDKEDDSKKYTVDSFKTGLNKEREKKLSIQFLKKDK